MGVIDTHSHIYEPEFKDDCDDVIKRAKEAGVEKVFLPNVNLESIEPMLQLCSKNKGYLYPMIGLHPEDIKEGYNDDLCKMYEMLASNKYEFIAVGEVGLDYYWTKEYYEEQKTVFEQQIGWAIEFGLPLMLHTRSAHQELVEIMSKYKGRGLSGVFHCFSGTSEEAQELLSFDNFMLGIGGVLTFKKSTLPDVLKEVPLERIVIETDAPYLAPVPMRGKRNEPAYARHTVERLANIYETSVEEIMSVTNDNVKRVFKCLN